jgi:hypothetical protein
MGTPFARTMQAGDRGVNPRARRAPGREQRIAGVHGGLAADAQAPALLEIEEEEPHVRVHRHVAQGEEHAVAVASRTSRSSMRSASRRVSKRSCSSRLPSWYVALGMEEK